MHKALIIVDVQNDYFQGGSMELVDMDNAASNCGKALEIFRKSNNPIFHIQHLANREGATFFIPGTPGCEINAVVTPDSDEQVLTKHFPSAFRDTRLNEMLSDAGINDLVICGAMSHMCIDTTVRAGFDLGYKCTVVSDACATRDLEFNGVTVSAANVQAAYMAALSAPFAKVLSVDQLSVDNQ